MIYLLPIFKAVSLIFAVSAVGTGAQAIVGPIGFSKGFGLALDSPTTNITRANNEGTTMSKKTTSSNSHHDLTMSYIPLMGVRQLATGLILLTFAYQNKCTEAATILAIIGIVVAGTDGVYLSRAGARWLGVFHALPGALISALACCVIFTNAS